MIEIGIMVFVGLVLQFIGVCELLAIIGMMQNGKDWKKLDEKEMY